MSSNPSDRETQTQKGSSKSDAGSPKEYDQSNSTNHATGLQYRVLKPHPTPRPNNIEGTTKTGKRARIVEPVSEGHHRRNHFNTLSALLPGPSDSGLLQVPPGRSSAPARTSQVTPSRLLPPGSSASLHTTPRPLLVPGPNTAPAGSLRLSPIQSRSPQPRQYFPFRHQRGPVFEQSTQLEPFLLGLSKETRYRIYKLLLVEGTSLELNTKTHTQSIKTPALLQVSRQIREEASHIWYGLNHFILTIRHGETALIHDFLSTIANLQTRTSVRLDIILSTCFQCNDLVGVAAILISCNIHARIKCVRSMYHVGHPQVMPCKFNVAQAVMDQNIRPSVATALLQSSSPQYPGAGFVIEESPAESFISKSTSTATREAAVLGYTPTYNVNMRIRDNLENAMGSVGLLLQ